jgi:hypothetical protein
MVSFKEHTEVLSEARKDLHSVFRRLRWASARTVVPSTRSCAMCDIIAEMTPLLCFQGSAGEVEGRSTSGICSRQRGGRGTGTCSGRGGQTRAQSRRMLLAKRGVMSWNASNQLFFPVLQAEEAAFAEENASRATTENGRVAAPTGDVEQSGSNARQPATVKVCHD